MSALAFDLPAALEAGGPPEARGTARDAVRLLVADAADGQLEHTRFNRLPEILRPGDLVVINVSATLPAAVSGQRRDGRPIRVHFATRAPALDASWRVIELRSPHGDGPERGQAGDTIELPGAELELVAPYTSGSRLLLARYRGPGSVEDLLIRHGQPIRYGYAEQPWPLGAYQNVYATRPGSAEMPSAGRPLTERVITALVAQGIAVAPITLHTGVSSPERHESPLPEQYSVPTHTARMVSATRLTGGRVIAIGTTVVRALETAAELDRRPGPSSGWTNLVIEPDRELRAVDGLVTGWHEPQASHLQMLEAIAGTELLEHSYREALDRGYLWHEFGDSHLILTGSR